MFSLIIPKEEDFNQSTCLHKEYRDCFGNLILQCIIKITMLVFTGRTGQAQDIRTILVAELTRTQEFEDKY